MNKIEVGIVGTGDLAGVHANLVRNSKKAVIAGIVGPGETVLQETADRLRIKYYTDLSVFIDQRAPDAVHIVAPAQKRYGLTKEALEKSVNVLVDTPMALKPEEAQELYDIAEKNGLLLCTTDHIQFYRPMAELAQLVDDGALGRIHGADIRYGIDTRSGSFKEYPEPNSLPLVFELPGSIYQNYLPAPLSVLLAYIGTPVETEVMSATNGRLPQGMADELSVLIKGEDALGTLTLSFAPVEPIRKVRIFGAKMTVEIDLLSGRIVKEQIVTPAKIKKGSSLQSAYYQTRSALINLYKSAGKSTDPLYGLGALIDAFYTSLTTGAEAPVSKVSALEVLETTEKICIRLDTQELKFEHMLPAISNFPLMHKEKILITGATGFVGRRLVKRLVKEGYELRVLVRKLSDISVVKKHNVEIFYGDIADQPSLVSAMDGIDIVVHAAVSLQDADCQTTNITGVSNLIEACHASYIDRLVYLSSCSVYDVSDLEPGTIITEKSPLEPTPERYTRVSASKQRAEEILLDAIDDGLRAVVLRSARVYGPGASSYTPEQCVRIGNTFLAMDNGRFEPQIVHIDNLIGAVLNTIQHSRADGEVFNVVDNEHITTRQYMNRLIKNIYPKARVVYVPYPLTRLVIRLLDLVCKRTGHCPPYNRHCLETSLAGVIYDGSKLRRVLDWRPETGFNTGASMILDFEENRIHV